MPSWRCKHSSLNYIPLSKQFYCQTIFLLISPLSINEYCLRLFSVKQNLNCRGIARTTLTREMAWHVTCMTHWWQWHCVVRAARSTYSSRRMSSGGPRSRTEGWTSTERRKRLARRGLIICYTVCFYTYFFSTYLFTFNSVSEYLYSKLPNYRK